MADFQIIVHGTIITIEPLTEAAAAWLEEPVSENSQQMDGLRCVDHHYDDGDIIFDFLIDGCGERIAL
jgi:hypothetical protein